MSDTNPQENEDTKLDEAAAAELEGVPEALKSDANDGSDAPSQEEHIAGLENELAEAKQQVLYAQAETQNVRRRLEKDAQDAKAYAATGFARDMLSVSDNLQRALAAIPAEVKDEEKWKGLINGIEATGRELETVFEKKRNQAGSFSWLTSRPQPASGDG